LRENQAISRSKSANVPAASKWTSAPAAGHVWKIARFPLNGFQICKSNHLNFQRPPDLAQNRGEISHGAVVGRKGLVQLRHNPPDRRGFLKKIDIKSGIGQIQSGLHSGNSTADNKYRSYGVIRHCFILLVKITFKPGKTYPA